MLATSSRMLLTTAMSPTSRNGSAIKILLSLAVTTILIVSISSTNMKAKSKLSSTASDVSKTPPSNTSSILITAEMTSITTGTLKANAMVKYAIPSKDTRMLTKTLLTLGSRSIP
jgi:hypothetical protein